MEAGFGGTLLGKQVALRHSGKLPPSSRTWGSITPFYKEKKGEDGTGERASGEFLLEFAREPGGSLPHFMDENTEAQTACPRSCGQLTAELLFLWQGPETSRSARILPGPSCPSVTVAVP